MMPGEVSPIFTLPPDLSLGKLEPMTGPQPSGFADLLDARIGEVNEGLMAAEETLQDFAVQ